MQTVGVLVAALAAFAFGALWYTALSKAWLRAAGIACDAAGKPLKTSASPFVISAVSLVLIAGMMRHVMTMSGLSTPLDGLMVGFGLGALCVLPWLVTCYAYAQRPKILWVIDGAYVVLGTTIVGVVLSFFL